MALVAQADPLYILQCCNVHYTLNTGIGIGISALFYSIGSISIGNQIKYPGIGSIGGICKGQYRHIGVSAKMWYRPIPNI